jgi:protein-disulfide isomerase
MTLLYRAVLAAVAALMLGGAAWADPPPASDLIVAQHADALRQSSAAIGNPRGDVTIVEFFDYTCPYCKAVEPRLEKLLKADKGVRLVLKEFPILTPQSLVAARVALVAAHRGKYAPFHQALMNYEGPLDEGVIFDTARRVGLDGPKLRQAMQAPEISDEIIANFNLARSLRLFQTPSFIVGNHILTGLSAEIDFAREVAKARRK